ncbi:MAG: sodium:calcium antiporter [Verrucomicrobiota bacterium JB022]|nr:sodium:calcium antiporter [Verrucomicrobiota bacterium JB022]
MFASSEPWALQWAVPVFIACALVILAVGTKLSALADELADRTGMGEAMMGAVFLGAITSLSGSTLSVVAATQGLAELSLANAYGGIAVQTAFLAIADLAYRGVNLEHAAASVENLIFGAVLIVLLGILLWATSAPPITVWGVHPISVVMLFTYVGLLRFIKAARDKPMWQPVRTQQTREDVPDDQSNAAPLWVQISKLVAASAAVVAAGWALTQSGNSIASRTGLNASTVGALGTAVATSLPELVTSIAAVRRGALTLAVGGILGGNCFDTLFAAVSDFFYRAGSIYHAASSRETAMISLSVIMTGVLLLGLIHREKTGPAKIGFESVATILIYIVGAVFVMVG